ncbi:NAD(P)-binding domain-containing protein, partial [Paraburkholderia sp. SG-MS1]|uniref:NAD(P)-binding domain-containing protein n=1 Tax=Paraburkholderia sp. SG-MS1 TaxID=2023741 RepID=UPI001446B1E4
MEIGFCGPGLMGAPMIRHLLRAGHTVHVWNRTRAKAEALMAEGARVADTPREMALRCEAVLLCVADAAAVEHTVFGATGLLSGDAAKAVRLRWIVDHSSIPPAATRAFAQRAAALAASFASMPAAAQEGVGGARIGWIDAPV